MSTRRFIYKVPAGEPVLRGIQTRSGKAILVQCSFCGEQHSHSWQPDFPARSVHKRGSHCRKFSGATYYIGLTPRAQRKATQRATRGSHQK